MRPFAFLGFGGAFLCAAVLAACGGGSGSSGGAVPSAGAGSSGGHSTVAQGSGTRITLTINRTPHKSHAKSRAKGRASGTAKGRRSPLYVDPYSAAGLQVAVSTTGANPTTQTIYADITSADNEYGLTASPLCTTNINDVETCTLTVPTLAANEQIVATEVDQQPTDEGTGGLSPGYGTGFPTNSNVLAVGTLAATVTLGGQTALSLGLDPVAAVFYDCTGAYAPPAPDPQPSSANFGYDYNGYDGAGSGLDAGARIVVTAGVASSGLIEPQFGDVDFGWYDTDPIPLPLVDVNGSPTPITVTANSPDFAFAPIVNNGTPPPAGAYAATASIPNDGYVWNNCILLVGVNVSASLSATATPTITVNNNLTATNSFAPSGYPQTMTYQVAPVSATPTTVSVANGGTATVTGTDYGAASGMGAESVYGAADGNCVGSSGTLATVSSSGAIDTSNWQQSFTISAGATAGTCSFVLYDLNSGVVTQPIAVTVNL